MKIWILGANGLLGKALVQECQKRAVPYVATGREVDLTNRQALEHFAAVNKPTHAINCGAYTDVDLAEKEKQRAFAVNAYGVEHLAHCGKICGFQVVHISTDYVFDGKTPTAYTEEDVCRPLNVYGQSKRLGEELLLEVLPTACVVRTSWLFGEGGKNFLSKLTHLLKTQPRLEIDDVQVNRATHVGDLAHELFMLLDCQGIWHFANRGGTTRYQIAHYLLTHSREQFLCKELIAKYEMPPLIAPRPLFSALSTEKVERFLKRPLRAWNEVFV